MEILEELATKEYRQAVRNTLDFDLPSSALIEKAYHELTKPQAQESQYLREVRIILNEAQLLFLKEPSVFKEIWKKRKESLEYLNAAVKIATITREDLPLVVMCRSVVSQKDEDLFADNSAWIKMPKWFKNTFFSWSTFTDKVADLLKLSFTEDLDINLFSSSNEEDRRREHLQLVCDYLAIYEKLNAFLSSDPLEDILKMAKDNGPYPRLVAERDLMIKKLTSEQLRLKKEKEALVVISQKQADIMDVYLRQNEKLQNKLSDLTKNFELALAEGKKKSDENRLLKIQVEKLSQENKNLKKESDRKLLDVNLQLQEENKRLREELSLINSQFSNKSKRLNVLESIIHETAENLQNDNYEKEVQKFLFAAARNDENIKNYSQTILDMFEKLNQELKDLTTKDRVRFF